MNKNNRISEFSLILITQDNHTFLVVVTANAYSLYQNFLHFPQYQNNGGKFLLYQIQTHDDYPIHKHTLGYS